MKKYVFITLFNKMDITIENKEILQMFKRDKSAKKLIFLTEIDGG